jgi:L-alanine-DL-glutamate epimerase-like enolase superfamily enzyme
VRPFHAPVYLDGYSDEIDAIDKKGNLRVPEGPGLGIKLDWKYIEKNKTGRVVYE